MEYIKVTNRYLEELMVFSVREWNSSNKFPFNFMYWVAKAIEKAKSEMKHFNVTRVEIIRNHAKLDEKGEVVLKDKKDIEWKSDVDERQAVREIEALRDIEVELQIYPIKLELLGPNPADVSFAEISILIPLLESVSQESMLSKKKEARNA